MNKIIMPRAKKLPKDLIEKIYDQVLIQNTSFTACDIENSLWCNDKNYYRNTICGSRQDILRSINYRLRKLMSLGLLEYSNRAFRKK